MRPVQRLPASSMGRSRRYCSTWARSSSTAISSCAPPAIGTTCRRWWRTRSSRTERVCALVKEISGTHESPAAVEPDVRDDLERRARQPREGVRAAGRHGRAGVSSEALTKREREVLQLISQGYSNKQGRVADADQPAHVSRVIGRRPCASLARETPRIWFRAALLHPID